MKYNSDWSGSSSAKWNQELEYAHVPCEKKPKIQYCSRNQTAALTSTLLLASELLISCAII